MTNHPNRGAAPDGRSEPHAGSDFAGARGGIRPARQSEAGALIYSGCGSRTKSTGWGTRNAPLLSCSDQEQHGVLLAQGKTRNRPTMGHLEQAEMNKSFSRADRPNGRNPARKYGLLCVRARGAMRSNHRRIRKQGSLQRRGKNLTAC